MEYMYGINFNHEVYCILIMKSTAFSGVYVWSNFQKKIARKQAFEYFFLDMLSMLFLVSITYWNFNNLLFSSANYQVICIQLFWLFAAGICGRFIALYCEDSNPW